MSLARSEYQETKQTAELEFTVNYHQHPEVGGMGHVSLSGKCGEEKRELNVYPSSKPSLFQPLGLLSFYIWPTKAVTYPIDHHKEGYSPITASYKIPPESMKDPKKAWEEMSKATDELESGRASFTIAPNTIFTRTIQALCSPSVNLFNVYTGMKTFDREAIDAEMDPLTQTNCAESVARVMEAGGMQRPPGIGGFATPTGINGFFRKLGASNTHGPKPEADKKPTKPFRSMAR